MQITYRCGFGGASADVPQLIVAYVRMRLGQFYEHREFVSSGGAVMPIPHVRNSIDSYRRIVNPAFQSRGY